MGLGDWILLALNIFTFAFSLIMGWRLIYHHSKFPDTSMGYHFAEAMRDEKRWEWANHCAGRLSILLGIGLLLVVPSLFRVGGADMWGQLVVYLICTCLWALLVVLLPVRLLKRRFGDK